MIEEERNYRVFGRNDDGTTAFRVKVETTDLYVRADSMLVEETRAAAIEARRTIEEHGRERPEFLTSFAPLDLPSGEVAPILRAMYEAAIAAGVGPMAAVAGAVAEEVARKIGRFSRNVTLENGGDIFISGEKDVLVGIYAGESPFTGKVAIELDARLLPLSVCTSSGTVGPSISLGNADAATIIAKSGALADAAASALGNRIKSAEDIEAALSHTMSIPGVEGALAIAGASMGCMGNIKLARVRGG